MAYDAAGESKTGDEESARPFYSCLSVSRPPSLSFLLQFGGRAGNPVEADEDDNSDTEEDNVKASERLSFAFLFFPKFE